MLKTTNFKKEINVLLVSSIIICSIMEGKQHIARKHAFPNIARYLFFLLGFPIALPWLVYDLLDIMWQKQKRKVLKDKVIYLYFLISYYIVCYLFGLIYYT